MKRVVNPQRWSTLNRVEHPPLMMKQLVQGVCGGLRWLETRRLAEHIAKCAIKDGYPCTKAQQKALGVKAPKRRSRHPKAPPPNLQSTTGSLIPYSAVVPAPGGLIPSRRERVVSFDVLDCTLGGGYHSGAVLENGRPYTRVVALDSDMEAVTSARELVREFGGSRLRFYCNRMSEIRSLFGEYSFDAIMIDPGPSVTQLENPERGFLLDDEGAHDFDLRYSPRDGVSALQYLNTVPQHTLSAALATYGILTPEQSMKMARAIRRGRPFCSSRSLLQTVEEAGYAIPEDGWQTQESRRKASMSWRFLSSLRGIINNEKYELSAALQQAFLLLRHDGRLVVFSRLPWEEELIRTTVQNHPHGLLCYTEDVDISNVVEYGHTRHTKMWVMSRVKGSAFALKNSQTLTPDDIRESSLRWMSGSFAGQTHGFPAHNFTFENTDAKERRVQRRNAQPPPFDYDDDNK